jgi:hypothetical protein
MVIVGAGCAGLSCARALRDAGQESIVLERARGVGGRAATRRVEGQPVDHGVLFYHGSDPGFLEALDAVPGTALEGWPRIAAGGGAPCLARAFSHTERRVAFADGVTAFPKFLARSLDVRRETRVEAIALERDRFDLEIAGAKTVETDTVVLALPAEQMRALLSTLPASPELDSARALLSMLKTDPCLTLIAGYSLETAVPEWDVNYPSESDVLLLASHDSRKRSERRFHAFVYQGSAKFSRRRLDQDPATWTRAILAEAARLFGEWAEEPSFTQAHRWRFGRANAFPLSSPLLLRFSGGAALGLAGECFHPALGVEGAFLSGRALARRLLDR